MARLGKFPYALRRWSLRIKLGTHGESVYPKSGTDFIPQREITNKCAVYIYKHLII